MSKQRGAAFAPPEDHQSLAADKLSSSGITAEDAAHLNITAISAAEAEASGHWVKYGGLPALKIPYHDPRTGKALVAHPNHPPFYRVRALREPAPKPDKFPKYHQLADSGVLPYYPIHPAIDWPAILSNSSVPLIITEGELKAAKACIEEFPTVGIGGVNSFQSTAQGFLPALNFITWVRRNVYIVYDSDLLTNPNVAHAVNSLSRMLQDRGAWVHVGFIPPSGENKIGLDDLLIAEGPRALSSVLALASPLGMLDALFELNKRYAVVLTGLKEVVDAEEGVKMQAAQLVYRGTEDVITRFVNDRGEIKHKPESAADAWLKWPLRRAANKLVFDPSSEPLTLIEDGRGNFDFNTWQGLAVTPAKGDVSSFIRLIDHIFAGAEPGTKDWFLDWLAYPLQNLGKKLSTAVIIHGPNQGTGKTLVAVTMGAIYGESYTTIGQRELTSNFNEWAGSKLFILGDDITSIGKERREIGDAVKVMITQKKVRINPKGVSAYELDDYANYYFTSNHQDVFSIENDDRRFFVHEVNPSVPPLPDAFYTSYMKDWLGESGRGFKGPGPSALLAWLLERDVSVFNPARRAPETAAKTRMRSAGINPVEQWAIDLYEDPDAVLTPATAICSDLVRFKDLVAEYAMYSGTDPFDRDLPTKMRYALPKAGFRKVHGEKNVKLRNGTNDRFFAIRDHERWLAAPLSEIKTHLGDTGDAVPKNGKVVKLTVKKRKY